MRTDGIAVDVVQPALRNGVLSVHDGGPGFDAAAVLRDPPAGHFGMRLLQDAVRESGVEAALTVESGAALGTTWRLRMA